MQEAESVEDSSSSSSSTQVTVQQQAVALVTPRQHENAPQNIVAPQQNIVDQVHAASTCTSASSSTSAGNQSQSITMSTHNRATSTSNTVTTSQAGHKRPRDNETDSTEDISSDHGQKKPQIKRVRTQIGSSTSQAVSESSCLDVDYQVILRFLISNVIKNMPRIKLILSGSLFCQRLQPLRNVIKMMKVL